MPVFQKKTNFSMGSVLRKEIRLPPRGFCPGGGLTPYRQKRVSCILIMANPLDSKGNYSATSNNTKLLHWPLMCGLLHLVQQGRAWAGCGPAQPPPRCTKCNNPPFNGQCTNHCIAIALLF